ncbi:MAG: hypothetical protein AAGA66_13890 [Bacteroidota bacterium]
MLKTFIAIRKNYNKLLLWLLQKDEREISSRAAARFFQLENYFADLLKVQIANDLPTIGEID